MSIPRGILNHNPGNLVRTGDRWLGQSVDQSRDPHFVVFDAPEYGIRAMARILRIYYARGNRTLRQIITTWAPPSENDTGSYIAAVCRQCGLGPDQAFGLDAQMPQIIAAIIQHENGEQPYTSAQIARGIALEKQPQEAVMAVASKQPISSTNTAIVGGGVSAVTEAVNWVCNVKWQLGMPPGVMSLVATVLISLWHAGFNRWLSPETPLPPPAA